MLAAFSGKLNVVKELVNSGASYDKKDNSGCTVLHYAVGKLYRTKFQITQLVNKIIFCLKIDGGNLECIQFLLLEGVEVDITDNTANWTPLLRAASIGGNKDVAELLLKYKANPNKLDKDNKRCDFYFKRFTIKKVQA